MLRDDLVKGLKLPCYLTFLSKIDQQLELLRSALPSEVGLYYSLKANARPEVLERLLSKGTFADVASLRELDAALQVGFHPSRIEFTGPGKNKETLEKIIRLDVSPIVVESSEELQRINEIANRLQKVASVSARISLSSYYSGTGRLLTEQFGQFGIDEEEFGDFVNVLQKCSNLKLIGLHTYNQSQILDSSVLAKNFLNSYESLKKLSRKLDFELDILNIGGGFGIPYFHDSISLDLGTLRVSFDYLLKDMKTVSALKNARLFVEAGRFLVGPAGFYLAQVEYCKMSRGKNVAILNGGFSQNMAVCGFGQYMRKNYKIKVLSKTPGQDVLSYTLAGPSCYSLDILATDVLLPVLNPGDVIAFENCGSYGASFSPTGFLGLGAPEEYFLEGP